MIFRRIYNKIIFSTKAKWGFFFFLSWSIITQVVNQVPVEALWTSLPASIINDPVKPRNKQLTKKEKRFFPFMYHFIFIYSMSSKSNTLSNKILYRRWVIRDYLRSSHPLQDWNGIWSRFLAYIGILASDHVGLFIKTPNEGGSWIHNIASPQIFERLC